MPRKPKRQRRKNYPEMYWESAAYNSMLFSAYRQQIMKLALNRYKWVNLPASCNERYLEMVLMYQGVATIAFPKKMKGTFFSTQVAQMSPPNVYDNPTKWYSIGNNGWRFKCNANNGVIVWDNRTRYPIMRMINMWAQELCDIRRTKQINRLHAKTPFVITCEQEQELQAVNLYKQVAGGEPAIIGTNGLSNIKVDVLQTGVKFMGEELTAEELNTWQQVYQTLGIENLTYKAERMVRDEVNKRDEPSDIMALDGLNCRREACDVLNDRFSEYLDKPIQVVWAKDNISSNYNYLADIKEQEEVDNGVGDSDD